MKHYRKPFTIAFSTLMLAVFVFAGCHRDKCKRVVCLNGECIDGTCNCTAGYFGSDCGTVINAGYLGSWTGTEECLAGSDHYAVTMLENGSNLSTVKLVGFWGVADDTIVVEMAADGLTGTIARQSLRNVEVQGTWLSNDRQDEVNVTYSVYNPGQSQAFDQCTANYLKD